MPNNKEFDGLSILSKNVEHSGSCYLKVGDLSLEE